MLIKKLQQKFYNAYGDKIHELEDLQDAINQYQKGGLKKLKRQLQKIYLEEVEITMILMEVEMVLLPFLKMSKKKQKDYTKSIVLNIVLMMIISVRKIKRQPGYKNQYWVVQKPMIVIIC